MDWFFILVLSIELSFLFWLPIFLNEGLVDVSEGQLDVFIDLCFFWMGQQVVSDCELEVGIDNDQGIVFFFECFELTSDIFDCFLYFWK